MIGRDFAVTAVILSLLPVSLLHPWIGILTWSWIGYMNPHRLTYGFAYNLPFAFLVMAATLVGLLFTREKKGLPGSSEVFLLLALWGWFLVTTMFAFYPEDAWTHFVKISKILLGAFLTIALFQDARRLQMLIWVIAGSIGFYGLEGRYLRPGDRSPASGPGPAGLVPVRQYRDRAGAQHGDPPPRVSATPGTALLAAAGAHGGHDPVHHRQPVHLLPGRLAGTGGGRSAALPQEPGPAHPLAAADHRGHRAAVGHAGRMGEPDGNDRDVQGRSVRKSAPELLVRGVSSSPRTTP